MFFLDDNLSEIQGYKFVQKVFGQNVVRKN
jgi:hypothetical protein